VFTLRSYAGMPASSGHVYLTAETYSVLYSAAAPPSATLPPVDFGLTWQAISDPIGPRRDKGDDAVKPGAMDDRAGSDTTPLPPTWDQPYYA